MRVKHILGAAYLGAVCYLFVSYWILWQRPIMSPLFAVWARQFGDTHELPLGAGSTRRYTQGIRQSDGVGLIDGNALVYLPFPASLGTNGLEIELRSLFASPGYRTVVTVLINDKPVRRESVGFEWQIVKVPVVLGGPFMPPNLKLQFTMEQVSPVPRYAGEAVLRFDPDTQGFLVWESGAWVPGSVQSLPGPVAVERTGNTVMVGDERVRLEHWPLTVALAPWDSPRLKHPYFAVELPTIASRSIRLTRPVISNMKPGSSQ